MKTIETTAIVAPDGTLTVQLPPGIAPGKHQVVLVIDERSVAQERQPRPSLEFAAYPVGFASDSFTARREDLYDDDDQA